MKMLGLLWKCLRDYVSKIDSFLIFGADTWQQFTEPFPISVLSSDESGRGLATLTSLVYGLIQWTCIECHNVVMCAGTWIWTRSSQSPVQCANVLVHTKCAYEVVNPLGTCLDPWWLCHCLYQWHSIHDIYALSWQVTTVSSTTLWLLINTNVINPMFS